MSQCTNCQILAHMVQKQQAEIAKLKRIITEAKGACNHIATVSNQVMTQHGSPYKYNLAKGAKDAALTVERKLR